MRTHNNN